MMERFADAVLRHSKAIIAIWVIVLIASLPLAYVAFTSNDVLSYDMQRYDDTESSKGFEVLRDSGLFDYNNIDIIIVAMYANDVQKNGIQTLSDGMNERMKAHYGENCSCTLGAILPDGSSTGKGLLIIVVPDSLSKQQETKVIRDMISDIRSEHGEAIGTTYVTGWGPLIYDLADAAVKDIKRIDPVAILLVLILIGLFFSSIVAAGVPPATIGIAFSVTMFAVYMLAAAGVKVFYITPTIALVSMLGAGCDYCIFIIARYREERRSGLDKNDALRESVKWAGESVLISGLCVIICLGFMSFCSYDVMRTMGIVLAIGIVVSLFAAVTLIPSIINLIGDRIFYPSKVEGKSSGAIHRLGELGRRYFRSSAKFSMKHAWAIVIASIVITVPLTYVVATEETSFDLVSMMPDSESKAGVEILEDTSIGNIELGGLILPVFVVMEFESSFAEQGEPITIGEDTFQTLRWTVDEETAKDIMFSTTSIGYSIVQSPRQGLSADLMSDSTVSENIGVMIGALNSKVTFDMLKDVMNKWKYQGRDDWTAVDAENIVIELLEEYSESLGPMLKKIKENISDFDTRCSVYDYYINKTLDTISKVDSNGHQYVSSYMILNDQPLSDSSMDTADRIRTICHHYEGNQRLDEMPKVVTTYTTGTTEVMNDISTSMTDQFAKIDVVVVVLILILLLFVMRSYLTPVRSVATILMGVVWSIGLTHLIFHWGMGTPVLWAIPILVFLICLGLGMDYDILLTTRIKEYVGKGMDTDTAIEKAVEHSGSIITICGLIMGGAYLSLILSLSPMLQQLGFAIGFTVLVDALVIRTYIVPAVMHLMGRWNWVGPKFLQK